MRVRLYGTDEEREVEESAGWRMVARGEARVVRLEPEAPAEPTEPVVPEDAEEPPLSSRAIRRRRASANDPRRRVPPPSPASGVNDAR